MNNILIIDSHKGTDKLTQTNLHWLNAKILADYLNADFIWSYPDVNLKVRSGYDIIIFVHTSAYGYIATEWLEVNPDAKIFYITNEYNLGEPLPLYKYIKTVEKKYSVISNYVESTPNRIVKKYVDKFHLVNLNALIYSPKPQIENKLVSFFSIKKHDIIYYGGPRKGRIDSFKKYLKNIIISTHKKNRSIYGKYSENCEFINRIKWNVEGLSNFNMSLYLEDEITRTHYNHLANRFYEALNYGCTPIFDIGCKPNVEKSGYDIPDKYFISSSDDIQDKIKMYDNGELPILESWVEKARNEKENTLLRIKEIING